MGKYSKKKIIIVFSSIFLVSAIIAVLVAKSKNINIEPEKPSDSTEITDKEAEPSAQESSEKEPEKEPENEPEEEPEIEPENEPVPGNCTVSLGPLTLINANFTVDEEYISSRPMELIDLTETYGIEEGNYYNGRPLMNAEAGGHLYDMILAYEAAYPGHTMVTNSCFRALGTSCGRLCASTGTSEHHSGYACDLIDPAFTNSLDTDLYDEHLEWQWLRENSFRFGFINRYPEEWAGGSMAEPLNVNESGTTGYFETWHYRYVGIVPATEIATGKYNSGAYDSLEHYLLMSGRVGNLLDETSCR